MRLGLLAVFSLLGCCPPLPGRIGPRDPAEYEARAAALREEAPPGFSVVIARPFAVVGGGGRAAVVADAEEVIGRAARILQADYFSREPRDVLAVWMFDGEESYRHHVNVLFGGTPSSPYGYYDRCERALVVNVALGYGTLIHEMVHAFMEANFPGVPTWFNEGFASLHEHTEERDGHLRGLVNWRLPGLQRAIRAGKAPRLEDLTGSSSAAFYGEERGMYYATARYLLYYLQERGLLGRYYHRFLARREVDPTGYRTLQEVLGERDMAAFERRWQAFVLALAPPG